MFLLIVILTFVSEEVFCQQNTILTQPKLIETNILQVVDTNETNLQLEATVSYLNSYPSEPLIYLSLVSFSDFEPETTSTLLTQIQAVT